MRIRSGVRYTTPVGQAVPPPVAAVVVEEEPSTTTTVTSMVSTSDEDDKIIGMTTEMDYGDTCAFPSSSSSSFTEPFLSYSSIDIDKDLDRVIGRCRHFLGYQNGQKTWTKWHDTRVSDLPSSPDYQRDVDVATMTTTPTTTTSPLLKAPRQWTLPLARGGVINFYIGMVNEEGCKRVAQTMENEVKYHQYIFECRRTKEPRLHILLSHDAVVEMDKEEKQEEEEIKVVGLTEVNADNNNTAEGFTPCNASEMDITTDSEVEIDKEEKKEEEEIKVVGLTEANADNNNTAEGYTPCNASKMDITTTTEAPGYKYHGIRMKAKPITKYSSIETLSDQVSQSLGTDFNIGVDVIVYRDGNDKIGWHSDDSQEENRVFCLIVESSSIPHARPLKIRPKYGYSKKKKKKKKNNTKQQQQQQQNHHHHPVKSLQVGDEEVELFPMAGDAYEMNGLVQEHYVHSLPAETKTIRDLHAAVNNTSTNNNNGSIVRGEGGGGGSSSSSPRRFALIFREGKKVPVPHDSGTIVTSIEPVPKEPIVYTHGTMESVLTEGNCYTKGELLEYGAHGNLLGGVSGNGDVGCDAIVVIGNQSKLREEDHLEWLLYSASSKQRGSALYKSFHGGRPVRVFRSSKLNNDFAAPKNFARTNYVEQYRYDGVYRVTRMWDEDGIPNPVKFHSTQQGRPYTFLLKRIGSSLEENSSWENENKLPCMSDYVRHCCHALHTMPRLTFDWDTRYTPPTPPQSLSPIIAEKEEEEEQNVPLATTSWGSSTSKQTDYPYLMCPADQNEDTWKATDVYWWNHPMNCDDYLSPFVVIDRAIAEIGCSPTMNNVVFPDPSFQRSTRCIGTKIQSFPSLLEGVTPYDVICRGSGITSTCAAAKGHFGTWRYHLILKDIVRHLEESNQKLVKDHERTRSIAAFIFYQVFSYGGAFVKKDGSLSVWSRQHNYVALSHAESMTKVQKDLLRNVSRRRKSERETMSAAKALIRIKEEGSVREIMAAKVLFGMQDGPAIVPPYEQQL